MWSSWNDGQTQFRSWATVRPWGACKAGKRRIELLRVSELVVDLQVCSTVADSNDSGEELAFGRVIPRGSKKGRQRQ